MVSSGQGPVSVPRTTNANLESQARLAQAWELFSQAKLPESETAFKVVASLGTDASQGLYGLGLIQLKRVDYLSAAILLLSSLRLNPNNSDAYYYFGEAWEKLNVPDAAMAFFKRALAIDPANTLAHQKLQALLPVGKSGLESAPSTTTAPKSEPPPIVSDIGLRGKFIRGRVSRMQQRLEGYSIVRDFLVECLAQDGSFTRVAIEMRGSRYRGFEGTIVNGDEVEIAGRIKPGELIKVDEVRNITGNSVVSERHFWTLGRRTAFPVAKDAERYSTVRGRVSMFQLQVLLGQKGNNPTVWTFRLRRVGPDGSSLPNIECEMRGLSFEGAIAENDEIEVNASGYKAGDVVGLKEVRNLSSNSFVRAHSRFGGSGGKITRPRKGKSGR